MSAIVCQEQTCLQCYGVVKIFRHYRVAMGLCGVSPCSLISHMSHNHNTYVTKNYNYFIRIKSAEGGLLIDREEEKNYLENAENPSNNICSYWGN